MKQVTFLVVNRNLLERLKLFLEHVLCYYTKVFFKQFNFWQLSEFVENFLSIPQSEKQSNLSKIFVLNWSSFKSADLVSIRTIFISANSFTIIWLLYTVYWIWFHNIFLNNQYSLKVCTLPSISQSLVDHSWPLIGDNFPPIVFRRK